MDAINPSHYNGRKGLEAIEVVENFLSEDGYEGYLIGSTLKYLLRYRNKNGLEDLKKAQWFLDKVINVLEEETTTDVTDLLGFRNRLSKIQDKLDDMIKEEGAEFLL